MKEIWKPIKDFTNYEISDLGRVRSCARSSIHSPRPVFKILKDHQTGDSDYRGITLRKDNKAFHFRVHHLVLEAFVGPRPLGYETNYKDGIKRNNEADNLEWTTHAKNMAHAARIGVMSSFGEACGHTKLRNGEVWLMKKLLAKKVPRKLIGKIFKVSKFYISDIARGRS